MKNLIILNQLLKENLIYAKTVTNLKPIGVAKTENGTKIEVKSHSFIKKGRQIKIIGMDFSGIFIAEMII